jgi:hypothetical protein
VILDSALSDDTIIETNPVLYSKDQPSDEFYLIIQGKVQVCSGYEGFMIEMGSFNYLGVQALMNDRYIPDFSAKVIGYAKLLKVRRIDYRKAIAKNYSR